jgi:hypothetical protein
MTDLDKAVATQMANMVKRTGKSLAKVCAIVKGRNLSKHGEVVSMLKTTLGMGCPTMSPRRIPCQARGGILVRGKRERP